MNSPSGVVISQIPTMGAMLPPHGPNMPLWLPPRCLSLALCAAWGLSAPDSIPISIEPPSASRGAPPTTSGMNHRPLSPPINACPLSLVRCTLRSRRYSTRRPERRHRPNHFCASLSVRDKHVYVGHIHNAHSAPDSLSRVVGIGDSSELLQPMRAQYLRNPQPTDRHRPVFWVNVPERLQHLQLWPVR